MTLLSHNRWLQSSLPPPNNAVLLYVALGTPSSSSGTTGTVQCIRFSGMALVMVQNNKETNG